MVFFSPVVRFTRLLYWAYLTLITGVPGDSDITTRLSITIFKGDIKNEAYVLDGSNIYTVDLSARTYVMDSLPVATDEISDIALTPDESRAVFIDLDNWIYLLDTSNGTLVDQKQVDLIRFTEPSQVAISPDGTMAIIANATDHSITFVEVNASSLNIVDIIDVGGGPTGVAFTQNGQIAVITLPIEGLIQIIDVASRTITATIMDDLGIAPLGLSIVDIGTAPPPFVIHKGDLDEDGDVDSTDLAAFAAEYGWPHLP